MSAVPPVCHSAWETLDCLEVRRNVVGTHLGIRCSEPPFSPAEINARVRLGRRLLGGAVRHHSAAAVMPWAREIRVARFKFKFARLGGR